MRKAIGMAVLFFGIVMYAAGAAALGRHVVVWPFFLQMLYFLIAGLVWVVPAIFLLRWIRDV